MDSCQTKDQLCQRGDQRTENYRKPRVSVGEVRSSLPLVINPLNPADSFFASGRPAGWPPGGHRPEDVMTHQQESNSCHQVETLLMATTVTEFDESLSARIRITKP
jgi:hypothetical protein